MSESSAVPAAAQPILRGRIDSPPPGSPLRRQFFQLSGWALAGVGPPAAVEIVLNGRTRIDATIGIDRPDVAVALDQRAAADCGWVAEVDLAAERIGRLVISLEVRAATGEYAVVAEQVHALGGEELVGELEIPPRGSTVDGSVLEVHGCARGRRTFTRVEVSLDGSLLGRARVLVQPPEPAPKAADPPDPVSGFEGRFVLGEGALDSEEHVLTVTAFDEQRDKADIAERIIRCRPWLVGDADRSLALRLESATAEALSFSRVAGNGAFRNGKRLLVFAHNLQYGGAELYLQDLISQLLPALEHCTVVSPYDGALGADLVSMGVDLVISPLADPSTIADYEGSVRGLASIVRASGAGVVFVNTLASSTASDAAVRTGVPTIWAIHEHYKLADWVSQHHTARLRAYVLERMLATLCDASGLVFVAGATRDLYLDAGATMARTSVVPYGIDVYAVDEYLSGFDRSAARRAAGIDEGAVVLVSIANFAPRKGQALLAESFGRICSSHSDAVLVLVGERGDDSYARVVRSAVDGGAKARVKIIPATGDTWSWYALSDIFVSASDVESMPRSILEAMTFGMPVLASSVGGVPEIVRDGENGWLVEPCDLVALMDGLDRALSTGARERAMLGAAGRELVIGARGFGSCAEEIGRVIEAVTQPSVAPLSGR